MIDKFKELLINAVNSTYSLDSYRDMMRTVKREYETMNFYREHLIALNRAFA
jgi:hypothetical protein